MEEKYFKIAVNKLEILKAEMRDCVFLLRDTNDNAAKMFSTMVDMVDNVQCDIEYGLRGNHNIISIINS